MSSVNAVFETEHWLEHEAVRQQRVMQSAAHIRSACSEQHLWITTAVATVRESIGTMLIAIGGRVRPTPATQRARTTESA